ncbi:hypothetical protein ACFVH9_11040 [Streptomyces hirsutus]|uniref:hypothetical protein n=1 Tax=Streptomyces hirsutus TaxID=35620 RepID=UPI00362F3EE6
MDIQNPSAPPCAQSADGADRPHSRATRRPPVRPTAHPTAGVVHENTRHTTRFTVIGNHLTQHQELSLLAIGLACHIQSLPTGARSNIKTLTARFDEGSTRIAAALRELEAHGYLRRELHRTPTGRIVTRTVSCNQPGAARPSHAHPEPATPPPPPPFRTPADPPAERHRMRNCDGCDRGFRAPESQPRCPGCRKAAAPV